MSQNKVTSINKAKKKKKYSIQQRLNIGCDLLRGFRDGYKNISYFCATPMTGENKPLFDAVRLANSDANVLLLKKNHEDNTVTRMSEESVVSDVIKYVTRVVPEQDAEYFLWDRTFAQKVVRFWVDKTVSNTAIPKSVGFKSDPETCFYRLPFDPIDVPRDVDLDDWMGENAPHFVELLARIQQNREAFMMRVASIFDKNADRKQAVYMSGPADSGKSQVQAMLAYLTGSHDIDRTAYTTLTNTDLNSDFWKESVVGKRVVCVSEASAYFLNNDEFKAVTGDDVHMINPKGRPMYTAKLDPLFFFFSNEEPAVQNKPEILKRIIWCPIEGFTGDMIAPAEYQAILKDELPYFLGLCRTLYAAKTDARGRIPSEQDGLQELASQGDDSYLAMFDRFFKPEKEGTVLSSEMSRVFDELGVKFNTKEFRELRGVWKRTHGIDIKVIRHGKKVNRYWVGLKRRSDTTWGNLPKM